MHLDMISKDGQRTRQQAHRAVRMLAGSSSLHHVDPALHALELTWFSPLEARDPVVLAELMHGQSTLLLQALAHLGV